MIRARSHPLLTLGELLPVAQKHGFAVGSFSPRYPLMIAPVLRGAEALASPLIVQVSQKDLRRCGVEAAGFAEAFFRACEREALTVPVTLHLDHTEERALIEAAVAAGFSSVMIDASDRPLPENIALTRAVADYAHAHGRSVEGELGTIGAFGFSETEASDAVAMTNPEEVAAFVAGSGVDALAVSVGTVHGVREGSAVTLDVARLAAIRERTPAPLVLHGGSGLGPDVLAQAIRIPGGGVSKVNLATDLELAMLRALGSETRLTDAQLNAYPERALGRAQEAVEATVREKIERYLLSGGCSSLYERR